MHEFRIKPLIDAVDIIVNCSGMIHLLDQADTTFCLLLSTQEKRLFQKVAPFGAEVEARFPSANEDIYEAAKCLALDRATACVMHLMRVCELGLKALATTINVQSQRDWGSYL